MKEAKLALVNNLLEKVAEITKSQNWDILQKDKSTLALTIEAKSELFRTEKKLRKIKENIEAQYANTETEL